ncbi:MAG: DUF2065 domain-containing protein [Pseudomonadota bacterium]
MSIVLWAIGLVLIVEGLVLALAPSRSEEVLEFLRGISGENRRMIGLTALAAGVLMIWLAGGRPG